MTGVTGVSATAPTTTTAGTGDDGVPTTGGDTTAEGTISDSGATGTTGVDSSTPKLDVGPDDTGEPPQLEGCRKVDFLFIIDNSGSMSDEQQNLISSFPGFISTIQKELKEAQDYHIMVIDTDAYVFAGCEFLCFANVCLPALADYVCGETVPEECEDVLGAGVIHPKGMSSSGQNCNFSTGARYMDSSEPSLTDTFSCAAKVGTGSTLDPERPMEAMVAAIAPTGMASECNTGFLREDAILVVTFITDEDDGNSDSEGTPEGWRASLIAAKKGDESALVVLGLFGDNDLDDGICGNLDENSNNGAEASPRLRQFVQLFGERGVRGSVCAPSYDKFFQDAVAIIDTVCDDFVPPM